MYKLSGFLRIDNQKNNTPGIDSPLGELSTYSSTFSKEKGVFRQDFAPGISFVSFTSSQSGGPNIAVPQQYSDHVLQLCKELIDKSKQLGNTVTQQALANHLLNTFPSLIFDMELGNMVSTPGLNLPEWISWKNPIYNAGNNRIKIWFSDSSFKRSYDDFHIEILDPVDDLMDLMRTPAITESALNSRNRSREMELITQLQNGHPSTVLRAFTYTLKNILQPSKTFEVTWTAVIYGNAGDNPDIIRQKIINRLSQVTQVTLNEWVISIEALFKTTEFLFTPKWLIQAIPDRAVEAGIYSPITTVNMELNNAVSFYSNIDPNFVRNHLQSINVPYRSLTLYSLGGVNNLNDKFKITDIYPDFLNVSTVSTDFSRMSLKTQDFSNALNELIIIAENESNYADLPTYIRRVTRYDKLWITRTVNNLQLMVYSKSNDLSS